MNEMINRKKVTLVSIRHIEYVTYRSSYDILTYIPLCVLVPYDNVPMKYFTLKNYPGSLLCNELLKLRVLETCNVYLMTNTT
jgi:hypothetical protein